MKNIIRFISCVIIAVLLLLGNITTSFASEKSPYEMILDEANNMFDLELGYVQVDERKVSLEEYREKTFKFAAEQRSLLDYIERNEECIKYGRTKSFVTKTRTKPTWNLGQYFTITATYTVYDGNYIGSCYNASLNMTSAAALTNTFLTNISNPVYSVVGNAQTATVTYTATVHFDNWIGYSNTTLYTEFYYNE